VPIKKIILKEGFIYLITDLSLIFTLILLSYIKSYKYIIIYSKGYYILYCLATPLSPLKVEPGYFTIYIYSTISLIVL